MLGDHELEALRDVERGFDGTAQNWLGSSAPWSLASEESPQACTGKNARGGGGVES
jgi:hypothetical protein